MLTLRPAGTHSAALLVHFTDAFAVVSWGQAGFALEEAVEVGSARKAEVKGDFLQRLLGVEKEATGFEYQSLVDVFDG